MYPTKRRLWPFLGFLAIIVLIIVSGLYFQSREDSDGYYRVERLSFQEDQGLIRTELQADRGSGEFPTKMIYTGTLSLQVADLLHAETEVVSLVQDQGGYVSDSRMWDSQGQTFVRLVLRIPATRLENSLEYLAKLGKVEERSLKAEDVTEAYYDLETRLFSKQKQEERYLEILAQAEGVEDVLRVERELERIRGDIEGFQGRLNVYDDRAELATITVTIKEDAPRRIGFSFAEAIYDATTGFLDSVLFLIVFGGRALPWLIVLAFVALVGKGLGVVGR